TSASRPSITPMPKIAAAKNRELLIPAAPIAAGPSGPTMIVSTMPMLIQPISARTTGPASRSMGASSRRMFVVRPFRAAKKKPRRSLAGARSNAKGRRLLLADHLQRVGRNHHLVAVVHHVARDFDGVADVRND